MYFENKMSTVILSLLFGPSVTVDLQEVVIHTHSHSIFCLIFFLAASDIQTLY